MFLPVKWAWHRLPPLGLASLKAHWKFDEFEKYSYWMEALLYGLSLPFDDDEIERNDTETGELRSTEVNAQYLQWRDAIRWANTFVEHDADMYFQIVAFSGGLPSEKFSWQFKNAEGIFRSFHGCCAHEAAASGLYSACHSHLIFHYLLWQNVEKGISTSESLKQPKFRAFQKDIQGIASAAELLSFSLVRERYLVRAAKQRLTSPKGDNSQLIIEPEDRILNEFQKKVLELLDGKALTGKELATALGPDEDPTGLDKKGLKELKNVGRVRNQRGVGYYRPDRPPEKLFAN